MFAEKAVINDGLIKECLRQLQDEAGDGDGEEIDFEKAVRLSLSYKSLGKIDNLTGFNSLTHLCLDNNVISEIENLGHLVNLGWLDLSFNNISKIEGLERLVNLQDLSLFSNKIEKIEGLDKCTKLNCLSIGNNKIRDTDSIIYLREFRKLRLVNLKGNPVCDDPDYKMFVIAHLKHLTYLDYTLVEMKDIIAAREMHQNHLMEFDEKEAIIERERLQREAREANVAKLREANLDIIDTLIKDMEEEDVDLQKLKQLPGLTELLEDYHDKVNSELEEFKVVGLEQHMIREKEVADFDSAITKANTKNDQMVVNLIADFERKMKRTVRDWYANDDPEPQTLRDLEQEGMDLGAQLRELEVGQLELFEKLATEFEVRLGEMRMRNMELFQNYYRTVEALETSYHEAVQNLAAELVEKLNSELNLLDDLPPETKAILAEKELLDGSIQASYDVHLSKLLAREELTGKRETAKFKGTLKKYRDSAQDRYRSHMAEINYFLKRNKDQVEKLIGELQPDDDGYD